ncbi:hypothetical protein TIFTF001_056710, partial [Ficus carica]
RLALERKKPLVWRRVSFSPLELIVLSGGVPSHCSSHKLWLLQLATTGARPARPE